MKRTQHLWLIVLGTVACLASVIGGLSKTPVQAQTISDDGIFTVYTYIDYDGSNIYASSYFEDDLFDAGFNVFDTSSDWQLSGGSYNDSGEGDSFSIGVSPGYTYNATFAYAIEYTTWDYGGDWFCDPDNPFECTSMDYPSGYNSIYVPYPPPQISSISPSSVYQGDQGTLTIAGSNFVENSGDQLNINLSGPSTPFTPISSIATCTTTCSATFSYDFSGYPAGTYTLSVSNNEGTSNSVSFTVNSESTLDPCAVTSNPHAGYSSIVSNGTTGSGTFAVSFSGTDFAALNPSVPYGPSSTPSSVAAHMASLITKNYFQYGLTAKAYGSNIVYSGVTTLGAVSYPPTGSSFTTNPSSTAASAAGIACYAAPPQPPSAVISMAFTGLKKPQDNLHFVGGTTACSELLGPHSCSAVWDWNLEGTVMVTDDASKWTIKQQIVSGSYAFMYRDSSGNLQGNSYTSTAGPDGPNPGSFQQTAGTRTGFWIDSPGPHTTTDGGSAIDSGNSLQIFSVSVCSTIMPSICATKRWSVHIVVDPGGILDSSLSSAKVTN